MPLILPVLRAFWVFSIVFESFKILKLPPPSTRNGGKPTIRAMSQRKRAMKGCMTVWLVWCCFATYERTLDSVVGMFVPFYSEIKSLVIIFFLITRARGAEPIYLHVLRPLVKPYVATLDVLLDVTHSLGDFFLLLASIPLNFVMSFYRPTDTPAAHLRHEAEGDQNLYPSAASANPTGRNVPGASEGVANGAHSTGEPTETVHGAVRTRRRALETAHALTSGQPPPTTSRSSSRTRTQAQGAGNQVEAQANAPYDVWIPPQAAYDEARGANLPTPPGEEPPSLERREEGARNAGDDWRKYEPFPSAYPPTPLVSTSRLPADRLGREATTAISEEPRLDEPGDWRKYEAFPSAYPATPLNKTARLPQMGHPSLHDQLGSVPEEAIDSELSNGPLEHEEQDFQGSLEPPRELLNPNSAGDSGDDHENIPGVPYDNAATAEEEMDIDSSYGDDEEEDDDDDFDVTLRTPARISRLENISKASSTLTDGSTGLSTVDNGSPLRTRTNSEASTLLNGSDSSSLAGRKRSLPFADEKARTRSTYIPQPSQVANKLTAKQSAVNVRAQQQIAVPSRRPTKILISSATLDESEADASDPAGVTVKKRRIASPRSTASSKWERPELPGKSTSDRTIKRNGVPVDTNTESESAAASNARTIRVNTRYTRVSASQPSIRLARRLGVNSEQSASDASVGDVPVTKKNHVAPNGRSRSSTKR